MPTGSWTVADHLRDVEPGVVEMYRRLVEVIEACGPVEMSVSRTAISFRGSHRGFAGAKPKRRTLDGFLDLQRRIEDDPRILRVSPYTKSLFVHQFRVTSVDQLDDRFEGWIREAYTVGRGEHRLTGRRPPGPGTR